MNCGKLSQSQVIPLLRTSNGIASTLTRSQAAISRTAGLHGASPTPQLPITTDVTPCHDDDVISGSQQIWAS
jgi:hypothetical protein